MVVRHNKNRDTGKGIGMRGGQPCPSSRGKGGRSVLLICKLARFSVGTRMHIGLSILATRTGSSQQHVDYL